MSKCVSELFGCVGFIRRLAAHSTLTKALPRGSDRGLSRPGPAALGWIWPCGPALWATQLTGQSSPRGTTADGSGGMLELGEGWSEGEKERDCPFTVPLDLLDISKDAWLFCVLFLFGGA